jgi:RNA polymerase sigma-70 factor (ECF subfamily)
MSDGPSSGDGQGRLEALVARYEGPLLVYAQRVLGGDLTGARDVVQETFLRLCRAPAGEVAGHEAAWLYTVCRRAALDVRRKERRMTLITEDAAVRFQAIPADSADPAISAERADSAGEVMRNLARLPENQKEAIVLKFGHGLSYKEIAEVTGHSVSNVGFLIHAGLKAVRERMGAKV